MNNIYGEAMNPFNMQRICGADEALVSAKCVPFSIGVDSGFQMQAKASFSGVFSFRPTRGRIADDGLGYPMTDNKDYTFKRAPCLIGSSIEDCISGFKTLCGQYESDYYPYHQPELMNENLYLDIFSQNDLFTIKIGIL